METYHQIRSAFVRIASYKPVVLHGHSLVSKRVILILVFRTRIYKNTVLIALLIIKLSIWQRRISLRCRKNPHTAYGHLMRIIGNEKRICVIQPSNIYCHFMLIDNVTIDCRPIHPGKRVYRTASSGGLGWTRLFIGLLCLPYSMKARVSVGEPSRSECVYDVVINVLFTSAITRPTILFEMLSNVGLRVSCHEPNV